jgi:hypothetical protein
MSSLSGIKKILDAYITANYGEVRTYTNYMLKRLMLSKKLNYINLKADTVINNAYLHVAGIDDHEADENKVKSYLLNTIKNAKFGGPTSLSRKQDEVYSQEYIATDKPEDDEITDKLKHEEIINLRKACINTYLNELVSPVEKRIAEAYFHAQMPNV